MLNEDSTGNTATEAMACGHGMQPWWGKLWAEWCPVCVWEWAVPLGTGHTDWANLQVEEETA